jgi:hypothetical protein
MDLPFLGPLGIVLATGGSLAGLVVLVALDYRLQHATQTMCGMPAAGRVKRLLVFWGAALPMAVGIVFFVLLLASPFVLAFLSVVAFRGGFLVVGW